MKTIFFWFIIALVCFGLSFLLYQKQLQQGRKIHKLLFILRGLFLFGLVLLVQNPSLQSTTYIQEKPVLAVVLDHSSSITTDFQKKQKDILEKLQRNSALRAKFKITPYSFSKELSVLDTLKQNRGDKTDIYNALQQLEYIYPNTSLATVLITDANQNTGVSYQYFNPSTKHTVFPVCIGDTLEKTDLILDKVTTNAQVKINHPFIVQADVRYQGKQARNGVFIIKDDQKNTVYRKKFTITPDKKWQDFYPEITPKKLGLQKYIASVSLDAKEANYVNNQKVFAVEVVSKQTKIALITAVNHPDIGALKKALQTRKTNMVTVFNLRRTPNIAFQDFDLALLYSPDARFAGVYNALDKKSIPTFTFAGNTTDWNFLNTKQQWFQAKKAVAKINHTRFSTSKQVNKHIAIDLSHYPDLSSYTQNLRFNQNHTPIVYDSINKHAIVSILQSPGVKHGLFVGSGFWSWRLHNYQKNTTTQDIDALIAMTTQELCASKATGDIILDKKNTYIKAAENTIEAQYITSGQEEPPVILQATFTHVATKQKKTIDMPLTAGIYRCSIDALTALGEYHIKVSTTDKKTASTGVFNLIAYDFEKQTTQADYKSLQKWAQKIGSTMYFATQYTDLEQKLLTDTSFKTIEKEQSLKRTIIDQKWLLVILLLLLFLEWFLRKHHGLL